MLKINDDDEDDDNDDDDYKIFVNKIKLKSKRWKIVK